MEDIKRFCKCCNKEYYHKKNVHLSNDINIYCQYLGCCNKDCFLKMPRHLRNIAMFKSFCYNNK